MPTGYTHGVQEGTTTDFKDFALNCARAFGALASIREAPEDEIPEELKIDDYYHRAAEKAKKKLTDWETISEEEATMLAICDYSDERSRIKSYIEKISIERERYKSMIQKVEEWVPPTEEHVELKNFMLQQLRDSMKSDMDISYYEEELDKYSVAPSGAVYKQRMINRSREDLKYAEESLSKAKENIALSNQWLKDLRNSL